MGVNEYKVAIGNEAVFTRIPKAKKNTGLTGMDMIRLALECCCSAKEALERICYYIEAYGQDACGGYLNKHFFTITVLSLPIRRKVMCWKRQAGFGSIKS
jgi:hypothetical protein